MLHGIDITIEPGELLVIVGASGAGKSTLARPTADDDELHAALTHVGASWVATLPAGLDTKISADDELSGAHTQQLALTRVLLAGPTTVVLDEATSLLTPGSARSVERSLWSVLDGRTVITIAHRLSTAHDADRIAVMAEGQIRELGSHNELLHRNGLYTDLWNAWNSSTEHHNPPQTPPPPPRPIHPGGTSTAGPPRRSLDLEGRLRGSRSRDDSPNDFPGGGTDHFVIQ